MPVILGITLSALGLILVLLGVTFTVRAYARLGTVKAALDSVALLKEEAESARRSLRDATEHAAQIERYASRLETVIRSLVELLEAHSIPVPSLPYFGGHS